MIWRRFSAFEVYAALTEENGDKKVDASHDDKDSGASHDKDPNVSLNKELDESPNEDPNASPDKKPDESPAAQAANFKKTFSRDIRVHFIGAW